MKQTREPEMFAPVLQPGGQWRERKTLYADVVFLRDCGAKVFRAGRKHHLVNGQRMDSIMLHAMADQWRAGLAQEAAGLHRGGVV